jgi:hypothetical protein
MTKKILRPTGAFTNDHPTHPATVVGSGDVLADDSDATYVQSDEGDFPYDAGLEVLTGYESGDAITLHIRLSVTGGGLPVDARGEVFIATSSGYANSADEIGGFSDGTAFGFGFAIPTVDGTILDIVKPLSMGAWSPSVEADVVAALEAGAFLDFNTIVNSNWSTPPTIRVYEAWIEVGEGDPVTITVAPRRIFQRHDGATHGAKRVLGGDH